MENGEIIIQPEGQNIVQEPIKTDENRNPDGTFKEGNPGGPGRPKGKTMKEYAREYFMLKTDEEKRDYIDKLEEKKPGFAWQMGEGNPAQDLTSGGEKIEQIPIYGGISRHNSDQKDIPAKEENPGSVGGDISQ